MAVPHDACCRTTLPLPFYARLGPGAARPLASPAAAFLSWWASGVSLLRPAHLSPLPLRWDQQFIPHGVCLSQRLE